MPHAFRQYKFLRKPFGLTHFLIFGIIALHILLRFPPTLSHDSKAMYGAVVKLAYADNSPPLTLMLWHFFDRIKEGAELMQLLNLATLWGACLVGMRIFSGQKVAYWFIAIPFVPAIFLEACDILKDTVFSFGYLFISMILATFTIKNQKLKIWQTLLILTGIFYYSMVKVQAQFIFPFMIAWLVLLQPSFCSKKPTDFICKSLLCISLVFGVSFGMSKFSSSLIEKKNNLHYWQYVKIYDLAGMSVFAQKMYVPDFLLKTPKINIKDIEDHYDYLWEPLIVYDHSPLLRTTNDHQRDTLLATWKKCVAQDPISYLKHRFRLWFKIMVGSAAKGAYITWADGSTTLLRFVPIFSIFAFMPLFPIFLYFWWLGLRRFKKDNHAVPLFMLSSMGLSLIFVLFVCSLASAARYIYFSWCCFMFAVPFAYKTWINIKNSKKQKI